MTEPVIAPFSGLRYNSKKVDLSRVMAPPYDVISPELQETLYKQDPHNVIRLILGKQNTTDTEANSRYTRSAADLKQWQQEEILKPDAEPSFYLYEQIFTVKKRGSFTRRGFLALRKLEPLDTGKVHPHEKTLSGPKQDRLLLTKACKANLSPIFALYSDPKGEMKTVLDPHFSKNPEMDYTDEGGVRHRFWRVTDRDVFTKTNQIVGEKHLFIADGHHRYETALNYKKEIRSQNPSLPASTGIDYVMMFFAETSDPGLLILPTHRVLQNRPGFNAEAFLKQLAPWFEIRKFSKDAKADFSKELESLSGREQAFGLLLKGLPDLYLIRVIREKRDQSPSLKNFPDAYRQVDTAILHQLILKDLLSFGEEDEKNPQYLRFVKDADEAMAAVNEPQVNAVFLNNSPSMEVLGKVTEAGQILPPKTTYFYPKILSGLVFNPLDPDKRVAV